MHYSVQEAILWETMQQICKKTVVNEKKHWHLKQLSMLNMAEVQSEFWILNFVKILNFELVGIRALLDSESGSKYDFIQKN